MQKREKRMMVSSNCVGLTLSRDVLDDQLNILLARGKKLKESDVAKLLTRGVATLWVEIHIPPLEAVYRQSVYEVEKLYEDIRSGKPIDKIHVFKTVKRLVEMVLIEERILQSLAHLQGYDETTYRHCVNVCIFSVLIAKHLNYQMPAILSLGASAILHDIGKCFVPYEVLNKGGPLTDEEMGIMRTHPSKGYRHLETEGFADEICQGALQHHERLNGAGYPLGLTEKHMHPFSRIIAIADFYDALTADRPYRDRLSPLKALEIMKKEMDMSFPTHLFHAFLIGLGIFPVETELLLKNGHVVKVAGGDEENLVRFLLKGNPVPYAQIAEDIEEVWL